MHGPNENEEDDRSSIEHYEDSLRDALESSIDDTVNQDSPQEEA